MKLPILLLLLLPLFIKKIKDKKKNRDIWGDKI